MQAREQDVCFYLQAMQICAPVVQAADITEVRFVTHGRWSSKITNLVVHFLQSIHLAGPSNTALGLHDNVVVEVSLITHFVLCNLSMMEHAFHIEQQLLRVYLGWLRQS